MRIGAALVGVTFAVVGCGLSPTYANSIDLATLALNGNAVALSANDLQLVNGYGGEASSAFVTTPINTASNLAVSFNFTLLNAGYSPQADGVSFIIQGDPAGTAALGSGGGNIGADGILNAVGVAFQSWTNNHATIFQSNGGTYGAGVYGGTQPTGNFDLGDQNDNVNVLITYNNGVLSYTATNTSTNTTVSDSLAFSLASLGPTAYIGFTGGSGLSYSNEDVHDFTASVPEPSTWAMMLLGFAGLGFAGYRQTRSRSVAAAA
jgi:hypothetical protein